MRDFGTNRRGELESARADLAIRWYQTKASGGTGARRPNERRDSTLPMDRPVQGHRCRDCMAHPDQTVGSRHGDT